MFINIKITLIKLLPLRADRVNFYQSIFRLISIKNNKRIELTRAQTKLVHGLLTKRPSPLNNTPNSMYINNKFYYSVR